MVPIAVLKVWFVSLGIQVTRHQFLETLKPINDLKQGPVRFLESA